MQIPLCFVFAEAVAISYHDKVPESDFLKNSFTYQYGPDFLTKSWCGFKEWKCTDHQPQTLVGLEHVTFLSSFSFYFICLATVFLFCLFVVFLLSYGTSGFINTFSYSYKARKGGRK